LGGCQHWRTREQHLPEIGFGADDDVPAPSGKFVLLDEAQHGVHVRGMRADQFSDSERRVRGTGDSFLARTSVLAQMTAIRRDVTGPVLGVDDKHSTRPDHHVIDVGEAATWPTHVVDRRPFTRQTCEHLRGCRLTGSATLEQLGAPLEPLGTLACTTRYLACRLPRHRHSSRRNGTVRGERRVARRNDRLRRARLASSPP
jgi:hypothetical protein